MNKYIVGAVVVIVAAALVLSSFDLSSFSTPASPDEEQEEAEQAFPATGSVDDAAAAILGDVEGDEAPIEESDPSALEEDETALSELGESADGNVQ